MQTNHSNFWLNNAFSNNFKTNEDGVLSYLASHKKAISRFINIVTGKNTIPVKFRTAGDSSTDGKSVIIGSIIDKSNYDSVVGLALHEAKHIAETNFPLLNGFFNKGKQFKELSRYRPVKKLSKKEYDILDMFFIKYKKDIFNILNIIEDRRIDRLAMDSAPGYTGYYSALYNRYFFTDESKRMINSSNAKKETFDNYILQILYLIHEDQNVNNLKLLSEINNLIDFKNINRLKSTNDALALTFKVSALIIEHLESEINNNENESEDSDNQPKDGNQARKDDNDNNPTEKDDKDNDNNPTEKDDGDSDTTEKDDGDSDTTEKDDETEEDGNYSIIEEEYESILNDIKDVLNGITYKGCVSKTEAAILNQNLNFDFNNTHKSYDGQVTQILRYPNSGTLARLFNNFNSNYESRFDKKQRENILSSIICDSIKSGMSLGKKLASKIKFKDENRDMEYNRQKNGKLDQKMLHCIPSGNYKIFKKVLDETETPVKLHFSVDVSSSMMHENKWTETVKILSMFMKSSKILKSLEVVIDLRIDGRALKKLLNENFYSVFVWDSRLHTEKEFKDIFKVVFPTAATPETICLSSSMNEYAKEFDPTYNNIFINISDGMPNLSNGNINIEAKKIIKKLNKIGYTYKGFLINSSKHIFNKYNELYGGSIEMIDTKNVNKIGKIISDLIKKSK